MQFAAVFMSGGSTGSLQYYWASMAGSGGVAYWAHIGGFAGGVIMAGIVRLLRPESSADAYSLALLNFSDQQPA